MGARRSSWHGAACRARHPGLGDAGAGRLRGRPRPARDPRTRGIHIHCLTGRSDPWAREEAIQAGIETYLTKPLDLSHLLQIVHNQVKLPDVLQASGLSLEAAREQLDVWENCGYGELKVAYQEGQGFTVRCIRPPL